jgi:GNAT superfamily N-acetyltransferase
MEVVDISQKHERIYFACLEDWSEESKEAGNHKELWYQGMKDKGLRVKLALEGDKVCGMIQYVPVEHSFAEGKDIYQVLCIWVHGHKQGIGDQRKRGIGKALLQAAEEDVKSAGAKGLAVWGISLPFWMKASWFKKHGYKKVDKVGMQVLLWKPFSDDAIPPKWIREKKKPVAEPGKVTVTAFLNGWCTVQNTVFERAKRAASEFGDRVEFHPIYTADPHTFSEWGISDALFIDGKKTGFGAPLSYEKIKKKIARRVKK